MHNSRARIFMGVSPLSLPKKKKRARIFMKKKKVGPKA
jgi:hypothetical protein